MSGSSAGPGEGASTGSTAAPHEVLVRAGGGARDYRVLVGRGLRHRLPGLLEGLRAHRWAVIADETVAGLYAAGAADLLQASGRDAVLLTFPAGEARKTREEWARLTDRMLEAGLGRDAAVLAVGGGVTGDLAGFVAATYMRGVPVVQLPTSLVAMVDAAVGGKTGVDTPAGKNLVGAFHPPALVVVDPETVATLPAPERSRGLVEALKHGAILDESYLAWLEERTASLLDADPVALEAAVRRSIEIKAAVVSRDETESGYREVLNFGHTVGHALEAASRFGLSHGAAVAIGMVVEARIGELTGVTREGTAARLRRGVEALGLASDVPASLDPGRVRSFLAADKKRRAGTTRFVLLARAGEVAAEGGWSRPVPGDVLAKALGEATERHGRGGA